VTRSLSEHYNPIVHPASSAAQAELERPKEELGRRGGRSNLALCCDIVLGRPNRRPSYVFSKIGALPDTEARTSFPRLVGCQKRTGIAMLGDNHAAEAEMRHDL